MANPRADAPGKKKKTYPGLGYVVVTMTAMGALLFGIKWLHRDVEFCRSVFRGLAHGRAAVQQHIDWEHLKAVGVDVGATYTGLPSDLERERYRQTFVLAFSRGFELTGARATNFVNWRVAERQPDTITVAADYPLTKQTLLFVIPSAGTKRIGAIRWVGQEHMKAEPCCGQKS